MQKMRLSYVIFLLLLSSCATSKIKIPASTSYCYPTNTISYDSTLLPIKNFYEVIKKDSLLFGEFNLQDVILINSTGSYPLFKEYLQLKSQKYPVKQTEQLKQKLINRLNLATIELSSLSSELECEAERSKQMATNLEQIHASKLQKLTTITLITSAVASIGSVLIKKTNYQLFFSIGIGSLSVILGVVSTKNKKSELMFNHKRNFLTNIWTEKNILGEYPPFIWNVLKSTEFNPDNSLNTLQTLKKRWIEIDLAEYLSTNSKLFFGNGGYYTSEELYFLANMINQLKIEIRSINQNLLSFILKLVK